nr:PD-(D/E)XK nuclease family protein [Bacteroidales bacterium]
MENSFLSLVAKDLYHKKGHHLHRVTMVFPNKRARLFFNKALYQVAGKPLWTPQYVGINELFALCKARNAEGKIWSIGDPIYLNGLLFQEYRKIFKDSSESFDDFYGWGKILLQDFDNIDKNLADAQQVFRLISETEAFKDDFSHLSAEQVEMLQSFFKQFKSNSDDNSPIKNNFVHLWNKMFQLYNAFKQRLSKEAVVYEGMYLREIAENWEIYSTHAFPAENYVFVGFNALNKCEEKLFLHFKENGKAMFYWDYDHYYCDDDDNMPEAFVHEAGRFMRRNLKLFPNELPNHPYDDFLRREKNIRIIASSSENAQAHYAASQWLKQYSGSQSAIVLCNESLLLPMLHSLPQDIGTFNITMGYPLTQTPVFSLIQQIVLLHCDAATSSSSHAKFRSKYSLPLLQNSYIRRISEQAKALADELSEQHLFACPAPFFHKDDVLTRLFCPVEKVVDLGQLLLDMIRLLADAAADKNNKEDDENENMMPLYQESLFLCHQALRPLQDMIKEGIIEVNFSTYKRLLSQVLNLSIPFSGEPLGGLQLMGLLETRNLDFDNLLFLSANEGDLPQSSQDHSFIPYHIRLAYGLSMPQHQDAISAYYFMRILQRAKNITLCYCNANRGNKKAEMSRFLRQLLMESGLDIQQSSIGGRMNSQSFASDISREGVVMPEKLSPSALKTFITCETKFYYERIAKLKAVEELSEEMDALISGNIFHQSMQHLYTELMLKKKGLAHGTEDVLRLMAEHQENLSVSVEKEDLQALLKNKKHLRELLEVHTQMLYYQHIDQYGKPLRSSGEMPKHSGSILLHLSLLQTYMERMLQSDLAYAPFRIIDMEMPISNSKPIPVDGKHSFSTHGIIDRIDYKDDVLRILDYKTGSKPSSYTLSWEKMFSDKASSFQLNALQTYLYALLLQTSPNDIPAEISKLLNDDKTALHTALFYTQAAINPDYSPDFAYSLGRYESQTNFRRLQDDFQAALVDFLDKQYFNSQASHFKRRDKDKICENCDFRKLCGR